jgi:ATP sulfurylase
VENIIADIISVIINDVDHAKDYIILAIATFQIIIITYLLTGGWKKLSKSCTREDVEEIIEMKFGNKLSTLEIKISYMVESQKDIKNSLDKVIFKNFA